MKHTPPEAKAPQPFVDGSAALGGVSGVDADVSSGVGVLLVSSAAEVVSSLPSFSLRETINCAEDTHSPVTKLRPRTATLSSYTLI